LERGLSASRQQVARHDASGRFVIRTAPAPLPPHVIFPVRCAVPPVSRLLQRHDWQALIFTVITAVSGAVLLALLAARRF
jgi:hypothetical protein